jgi:LysM repeat protein
MKNARLLTLSCLFTALLAPASSRCEDFLLFAPKPATGDQLPSSPDQGVLVRSVTVKRGDTLADLSRKHIGVGSYFPQVLLFNKIKNPDLIYPGEKLLVPVPPERKSTVKKSINGKRHHAGKRTHFRHKHAAERPAVERPAVERPAYGQPAAGPVKTEVRPFSAGEQDSYRVAKQAYLAGRYQKALDLFGGFLRKFPNSKLAPDASLYQADCLLHLSGE